MKKKARILQLSSVALLIIALILNGSGMRETAYFTWTMILAVGVAVYWSVIKLKTNKRDSNNS